MNSSLNNSLEVVHSNFFFGCIIRERRGADRFDKVLCFSGLDDFEFLTWGFDGKERFLFWGKTSVKRISWVLHVLSRIEGIRSLKDKNNDL